MKKRLMGECIGLIFAISLVGGCVKGTVDEQETIAPITAEDAVLKLEQDSSDYIEEEDALYSVSNHGHTYCAYQGNTISGDRNLSYYDEVGEMRSLCSVRGCMHESDSCVIYLPDTQQRVYNAVYMNNLYSVVQDKDGYHLFRYALKYDENGKLFVNQGEYLMTVCKAGKEEPEFILHRGYLYFAKGKVLKRVEINPGQIAMTFAESKKGNISELRVYGNWLYYMEGNVRIYSVNLTQAEEDGSFEAKVCLEADEISGYSIRGNELAYTSKNTVMTVSIIEGVAGEAELFYEREGYNIRDVFYSDQYLSIFECTTYETLEEYVAGTYIFVTFDGEKNKISMDLTGMRGIYEKKLYGFYPLTRQLVVNADSVMSGFVLGTQSLRDIGVYDK